MDRPRHYIKEWRKRRGFSLRKLQNRLLNPDGSYIISYASLSRIERGLQPYDQPTLEALADALSTDAGSLLMRDPSQDEPIWSIWDKIPEHDRPQALRTLQSFARTGTQ